MLRVIIMCCCTFHPKVFFKCKQSFECTLPCINTLIKYVNLSMFIFYVIRIYLSVYIYLFIFFQGQVTHMSSLSRGAGCYTNQKLYTGI